MSIPAAFLEDSMTSSRYVCVSVKRDLFIWQKRPIAMSIPAAFLEDSMTSSRALGSAITNFCCGRINLVFPAGGLWDG